MIMENSKHYDKYFLKRNPSNLQVIVKDDEPVLGELAKHDCPLESHQVKILNSGWKASGIYYVEIKDDKEAKEAEKALRVELFAKANELVENGILDKAPAKNIKTEDLQTLINENKGE